MADLLDTAAHEWFSTPGPHTDLGPHRFDLAVDADGRPPIDAVVAAVQGLVVYDLAAEWLYGTTLDPERADDIHVRPIAALLDRAVGLDHRPLTEARPVDRRVAGRCHTFAKLTVAILRSHHVPARARCGFGAAFRPGYFEDHWVAEYWDQPSSRWRTVDAQLDQSWVTALGYAGDPLDVTEEEFVTAGRAWTAWRAGTADADRFGLSAIGEHGAHWIAGNLRLDGAALNRTEMLPWDVWGTWWEPDGPAPEDLRPFDEMAELTNHADHRLTDLQHTYRTNPMWQVPPTVFNVTRATPESVEGATDTRR